MAADNKKWMVLSHSNSIIVSNCQQPSATSVRQPLVKFIHLITTQFCIKLQVSRCSFLLTTLVDS